jgi:hypothetical protein
MAVEEGGGGMLEDEARMANARLSEKAGGKEWGGRGGGGSPQRGPRMRGRGKKVEAKEEGPGKYPMVTQSRVQLPSLKELEEVTTFLSRVSSL